MVTWLKIKAWIINLWHSLSHSKHSKFTSQFTVPSNLRRIPLVTLKMCSVKCKSVSKAQQFNYSMLRHSFCTNSVITMAILIAHLLFHFCSPKILIHLKLVGLCIKRLEFYCKILYRHLIFRHGFSKQKSPSFRSKNAWSVCFVWKVWQVFTRV